MIDFALVDIIATGSADSRALVSAIAGTSSRSVCVEASGGVRSASTIVRAITLVHIQTTVSPDAISFVTDVARARVVAGDVGTKAMIGMTAAIQHVAFVEIDAAPITDAVAQVTPMTRAVSRSFRNVGIGSFITNFQCVVGL